MSPRSDRQRPGVLARFGIKALVAALLLAPAISLGLAEPIADIALAKRSTNNGGVSTEDFAAPRYRSTITINDNAPASPYGSTINVSGLSGQVQDVNLILRNVSHDRPEDISVMLQHQGRTTVLMRLAGGTTSLGNANIVLDNDAITPLPDNSPIISNFAYIPRDWDAANDPPFGGSAPGNIDNNANPALRQYLDVFNGTTANGTWTLWVRDDAATISGVMGGWQLEIVTNDDDPYIAVDTYKTKQNKKLNVSASEGVLRTDADHGGDNLSAHLVSGTGPRKGKLKFHENGSFTYKPKKNKTGRDSFEYFLEDELGASIDGNGKVEIKIKKDKKKHKKHKGKNKNNKRKRNRR